MSTLIATNGNITNVNTGTIKDSTGNTTAMTIDSTGRVKTPARPAFRAGKTATQTASGTNELVTWDVEVFDIGGNFASNVFTAPIAGLYQFSIHALSPSNTNIEDFFFGKRVGGTGSITPLAYFRNAQSSGHETSGGTIIEQLAVGDTFGVYLTSANDAIYGDTSTYWTSWSGYLIG